MLTNFRLILVGFVTLCVITGCGGGPQSSGSGSPGVAAPTVCAPDVPPGAVNPPGAPSTTLQLQGGGGLPKPGGTVDLNLNMNSTNSPRPSAVQWTLAYSGCLFSNLTVTPGQNLTAASKTIVCDTQGRPGLLTCVLYGMNQNEIADGTLATLHLTVSGIGTNATFTIKDVVASPPAGTNTIQSVGSALGL